MKLYILRHGEADWPDWNDDDDLRPLTETGKAELHRAAKFFKQIGVAPSHIFASPLPRAAQTAQIIHQQIGGELHNEATLSPGATPSAVKSLLKDKKGDVMLVGHEPDLSEIIRHFTGARVKMSKAGLARLDFDDSGQVRLIWLLPPKISVQAL
jgi:phosphohistidine phosphatase